MPKSKATKQLPPRFKSQLEQIGQTYQVQATSSDRLSPEEQDTTTRQDVARKFVRYYFGILLLIVIGIPFYTLSVYALFHNDTVTIPFKDAILTYSAVVGPTFGLVVAYYFKTGKE